MRNATPSRAALHHPALTRADRRPTMRLRRLAAFLARVLRDARETRELIALDDRELRDIGTNHYEVAQALKRPGPALAREQVEAVVARAQQARSEAMFRTLTAWMRWLSPFRHRGEAMAGRDACCEGGKQ